MKLKQGILLSVLCILTTVSSGCKDKNNNDSDSNDYENLEFTEDFTIENSNPKSVQTFELSTKPSLTGKEICERFEATVEQYFPGVFSADEKTDLYAFVGNDKNGETINGKVAEYRNAILNDEIPTPNLWLTSNKAMIQMDANGGTQTITGPVAYNMDDINQSSIGMYCAADENDIVEKIHIPPDGFKGDQEYALKDGKVKLADAISFTKAFLNESFDKDVANPDLIADITDVWVVDMGDGIYGYHFWLTTTYRDIRMDTYPMDTAIGFDSDTSTCKLYSLYPGYAFMIEKGKFDSIMAYGYKRACNIGNQVENDTLISYEEAKKILSESISTVSKLSVSRAELVYTPYKKTEKNNMDLIVNVAWRFTALNPLDAMGYICYVNAVSGEFDYYKY